MKIELKNVKHAAFASEETNCFEATVYIDGKREGNVRNDGHGGCNYYHPHALETKLGEHAETLPPEVTDWDDSKTPGQKFVFQPNADTVIDRLLVEFLQRRDLTRLLSKKVVFVDPAGDLRSTKALDKTRLAAVLTKPEQFKAKPGCILNLLPVDQALQLYIAHG